MKKHPEVAMMILAIMLAALSAVCGPKLELAAVNTAPVFNPEHTDVFYGKKPRVYLDGEWCYKVFFCTQNEYAKTVEANAACFEGTGADWQPLRVPNYADVTNDSEKRGLRV